MEDSCQGSGNETEIPSANIQSESSENIVTLVDTTVATEIIYPISCHNDYFTPIEKNVLALDAMKIKKLNTFATKFVSIQKEEDRLKILAKQVRKMNY